jgi:hypothetical protein
LDVGLGKHATARLMENSSEPISGRTSQPRLAPAGSALKISGLKGCRLAKASNWLVSLAARPTVSKILIQIMD